MNPAFNREVFIVCSNNDGSFAIDGQEPHHEGRRVEGYTYRETLEFFGGFSS